MPGSVLFVGDMHLGRHPSRLPDVLRGEGLRASELGPVAAWRRAVERARDGGYDAVVLAGDVVDSGNALFEALGPLEEGIRRLEKAGVRVIAISGNHDGDVLPGLAAAIDGFRLLGEGGTWETIDLVPRGADGGAPFARLVGWSFPGARFTESPLGTFPELPPVDVPTLGVLHADLDQASSPYAPVARSALEATGLDAWFLGHVHVPSPLDGPRPIGYLGSLVGLDPGEPGARGPVRVDVGAGGISRVERCAGGPLRWERIEVRLDEPGRELRRADELPARLKRALEETRDALGDDAGGAIAVGCRLVLRGRTPAHRALREVLESGDVRSLLLPRDGVRLFVEKVVDEAQPPWNLEALAGEATPPGRLARQLLALEAGGDEADALIREARADLESVSAGRNWAALGSTPLDRERMRGLLLEAGRVALEELLAQDAAVHAEAGMDATVEGDRS